MGGGGEVEEEEGGGQGGEGGGGRVQGAGYELEQAVYGEEEQGGLQGQAEQRRERHGQRDRQADYRQTRAAA